MSTEANALVNERRAEMRLIPGYQNALDQYKNIEQARGRTSANTFGYTHEQADSLQRGPVLRMILAVSGYDEYHQYALESEWKEGKSV
jgi:hypothetical protein